MNTEKLKSLMIKKNVTQSKLAEIAGTSQTFVSYMLKGYRTPSVAVLKAIADHFEIKVDDLL